MGDIADIVHAVFLEYIILRSTQEIAQLPMKKLFLHDPTVNVTAQYCLTYLNQFSKHVVTTRPQEC